jgi:hypothetical protein
MLRNLGHLISNKSPMHSLDRAGTNRAETGLKGFLSFHRRLVMIAGLLSVCPAPERVQERRTFWRRTIPQFGNALFCARSRLTCDQGAPLKGAVEWAGL